MGLRYLFLALAIAGVYLITRHFWRQNRAQRESRQQSKRIDSVKCAYCGLHLPREEAINKEGDLFFCNQQHQQAMEQQD